ncbi:Subtilisin-like protease [Glycine max]|nr:Subtilisin-like protease [Glycine max]KAH1199948.1 Subtilisin-like protease [Glycine max]KAH1199949.1 Subtilisin-like protease [Glycine max]
MRAYLLHLVGCTLIANKSATHVDVVHLEAFRDLGESGRFSWGVAALVHMHDQLNEVSQTTTRQIVGYITLLQIRSHDSSGTFRPFLHHLYQQITCSGLQLTKCVGLLPILQVASCYGADVLAAIDQAIDDGVDVINVSFGVSYVVTAEGIFTDEISIGAFHAISKNILLVASAGNDGPTPGTVANVAPCVFTIAASTLDRDFSSNLTINNQLIEDAFDKTLADAFAYGSGHVRPDLAIDPGLVYDLSLTDYLNFLCASGYDQQLISALNFNRTFICSGSHSVNDLNYPSITLPNLRLKPVAIARTVTNVGPPSTYTVSTRSPNGYSIAVVPPSLTFTKIGERKTFKVIVQASSAATRRKTFGASFGPLPAGLDITGLAASLCLSSNSCMSSPQYTIHLQESATSDCILEAQKSCNTCIMVSIKILACWQILLVFLIHPSPQVVCFSKMVSLASAATTVSRNQTSSRKKSKEGKKHAREGETMIKPRIF